MKYKGLKTQTSFDSKDKDNKNIFLEKINYFQ